MVKYIVLVIVAVAILYVGFIYTKSNDHSRTDSLRDQSILNEEYAAEGSAKLKKEIETSVPVMQTIGTLKSGKNSIEESDDELPKKKRKLLGGADVEWIEPDISASETSFGNPPQ